MSASKRRLSAPQLVSIILIIVGLAQMIGGFVFTDGGERSTLIVLGLMNFVLAAALSRVRRKKTED